MSDTAIQTYVGEAGTYTLHSERGGCHIRLDGDKIGTAPQQYGVSGNYLVTLDDGQVLASTNWLGSILPIMAQAISDPIFTVCDECGAEAGNLCDPFCTARVAAENAAEDAAAAEVTPDTDITHRHADGTEHAHAGSHGFEIGAQVIADRLGDCRDHSHTSISLVGPVDEARPSTGPVVWSERDSDEDPGAEDVHLPDGACCAEIGDVIGGAHDALSDRGRFMPAWPGVAVVGLGGNVQGVEVNTGYGVTVLVTVDDNTDADGSRFVVTACTDPPGIDTPGHDHTTDDPTRTGVTLDGLDHTVAEVGDEAHTRRMVGGQRPRIYLVHDGNAYCLAESKAPAPSYLLTAALNADGTVDNTSWAQPMFECLSDETNTALDRVERLLLAVPTVIPE